MESSIWSALLDLTNSIDHETDKLNWYAPLDEAANAYTDAEKRNGDKEIYSYPARYMKRLLWRLRQNGRNDKWDEITETRNYIDGKEAMFITIRNYTYKAYLFARSKGGGDWEENNIISIPEKNLSLSQLKALKKKINR